ncbi:MAG: DNA repair protein RadA [Ruminococcaceae bacterium]|nr:DNA repair protein RadA [Oscillospiraceae bacterium]
MKGLKTIYVCSNCEYHSPKWMGKCPSCNQWNTMVEDVINVAPEEPANKRKSISGTLGADNHAISYDELEIPDYIRSQTGLDELDRVLGGGLVHGSVVLISGEPGIGKSTLLMQISECLGANRRVLYISGEESGGQIKLRAKRLGVSGKNLYILTETNLDSILKEADKIKPDIMIIDSIQTIYEEMIKSAPGSITQVRESALTLINRAKSHGISMLLVGHVNKEGGIAGPKVLEHMVDAVLCFEGEKLQSYRIIRANKNRFGSTNEIGVFEMTDKGLVEIPNPSEMLLSGRPKNTPGNCAVCTIEGTRPIIAEIQALVSPTAFPSPRRTSNGIDYNRLCLIIAVLEKRLGLKFYQNDVYMNVIGGLYLNEPASDAAIALALISSLTDKAVPDDLIAIGELGLSGECRAVSNLEQRVKEAARLGFTKAIVPYKNVEKRKIDTTIELIPIHSIYEAIRVLVSTSES